MPIRILPEETINKIAAGEVVEHPANAVKELLENSIDAGSTAIELEIKGAGLKLLRVRDNGAGIAKDDIKLAVTRHATSKITEFDDLEKIGTMGFRGEALPSIAAVSKLLVQSQLKGSASGWEIRLAGGKLKSEGDWAGAPGTNIEVSDLFFNTPARAKFQKSDTTERSRILKTAEELALAYSHIAFKIISEKKTLLHSHAAENPLERIIDIFGNKLAESLLYVKVDHPHLKIKAYLTKRENSQSTRKYQFLFVNRRPVNLTRSISHALYEAYRENLPAGRHPGAFIFLETNPSDIDINIHPTKREIRFSKESQIHDLLYNTFKEAVSRAPISRLELSAKPAVQPDKISYLSVKEPLPGFSYMKAVKSSGLLSPPGKTAPVQTEFERQTAEVSGAQKILGQIDDLYIIAHHNGSLLIIDQHAAAERVRYEKYVAQWQSSRLSLQPLLFPETIELPPSLWTVARENLGLIKDAGWEIEEFGPRTLRVSAVPAVLGNNANASGMLKEILEAILNEAKLPKPEKIEKIIRASCRSSIKAGDAVSPREAAVLIDELFRCKSPNTCPHGRPTMLKLTKPELDKHFSR